VKKSRGKIGLNRGKIRKYEAKKQAGNS